MTTLLSTFKPNPSYEVAEEATLRQNADVILQGNINTEASTRQSSDLALQNSINSEITARQNAVATLQANVNTKVNTSDVGVTVASLVNGTVPSGQLPSFVDDVLEFNNQAAFPATGEAGKIYVAKDTNKTYRWSGSTYIYITSGAVDSVNGKTGVVTLTKADVGLGSVDNTADSTKNVLSATKLTTSRIIGISGDVTGGVYFDGSANATIGATLANSGVGAGTYRSVTVDAKGRVTGGSNPTTLGGYGITDAQPSLGFTPVQQGGGANQGGSKIYIGWSTTGDSTLRLQVDYTDFGQNWPINVNGSAGYAHALNTINNYQVNSLGVGVGASGGAGDLRATGNITAYYSSDARLKENVVSFPYALETVKQLRGVRFDWTPEFIQESGGEDGYFIRKSDIGVIADELEQVLPELVATKADGYKGVKYDRICAVLIEAIKELNAKVETLQNTIDDLKSSK